MILANSEAAQCINERPVLNNCITSRVMVVTGGSRGIGAAVCRLAASRGYRIAMSYRSRHKQAQQVVNEVEAIGGSIVSIPANVAVESDVVRLFETAANHLGPITALVNNAGILESQTSLVDMTAERIDRIFAVNVRGGFLCAREAVRRMALSRGGNGGAIVNISSIAARLGAPNEYVDYAASKGAIDTMTIGLAKEVASEGIRVNAIRPGIIDTEIHASGGEPRRVNRLAPTVPLRRAGSAEEIANTILWLLSDEASYLTGTLVDVSGGR